MFSSMTMASSTTKPTDRVSASRDRLSRLKPSAYMTAKVPTTEIGKAKAGITVAEALRRNSRITSTTRQPASIRVNCTSSTDWLDGNAAVVQHGQLDRGGQLGLEARAVSP